MSLFVLVHGAFHGSWCWDLLRPELEARGHRTIAMDLPAGDGTATFERYADIVVDAWPDGEDAIVVGHSLGAMTIPIVATRRAPSLLVFLCPVVPNFRGFPWEDAPSMEAPGAFEGMIRHDDGTMVFPTEESATRAFYHDCTPEIAAWAFEHLRAQNSTTLWSTPYPLSAWPDVPRAAIIGTEDRTVTLEHARHVCAERLQVEPVVLESAHSPFLSCPDRLADSLDMAARAL